MTRRLLPLLLIAAALAACTSANDSVRRAKEANNVGTLHATSEEASDFLVEMADARRMDYAEGSIALTRATRQDLRDYGAEMARDQTQLLQEIEQLAAATRVALPDAISDTKQSALKGLVDEHGEDLDRRFISMITIDHERDVAAFTKAAAFEHDPVIRAWATRRLPLIQRHLDEIKALASAGN